MNSPSNSKTIIQSGSDYFISLVQTGITSRGLEVSDSAINYLAKMLTYYVDARNLHEPEFDELGRKNPQTLAELWLTAQTSESSIKKELLRKLGDRSLYISGFFSESLNRSLVDLDYYYSMGTSAYQTLASESDNDRYSLYSEISEKFLDFVDVFNIISHDSFVKTDKGILRLYETYLRTGSAVAREKLEEVGVCTVPHSNLKKALGH